LHKVLVQHIKNILTKFLIEIQRIGVTTYVRNAPGRSGCFRYLLQIAFHPYCSPNVK